MKRLTTFLLTLIFLVNQTVFGASGSDILSTLRPEKTRGPVADKIEETLRQRAVRSTARGRIILLFDIDHTLLDRDEKSWPESPTYKPFIELLKKAKELNAKIGLLTNNDYDLAYKLVLQFVPPELRQNLVLYAAGPLQKYTFDKKGRPIETRVIGGSYITPGEKKIIFEAIEKTKRLYLERLNSERQTYERLYPGFPFKEPRIEIRGRRKNGYVSFIALLGLPSKLWPSSSLRKDEKDERLFLINKLKNNLPPELRQKLWVRRGGTKSIDISKRDTNKAAAISDIIKSEKIKRANILYFADEFAPNEADAIVATAGVRCISVNVNPDYDIPEALWAGEGPEATARWMNKVLAYAETEGLAKALNKAEDKLLEKQADRLNLKEFIGRLRDKALVPDGIEEKTLLSYATVLLKALERFSGVISVAAKPRGETLSIYELLDYVESSNLFDEYRIKRNLPVVIVFKGSVYREDDMKTPWRVVYTYCSDFDSFTTIYGDEANSDFILGLGGVKYYRDIFNLKQRLPVMLMYNVRDADIADTRNSLWGIPFNGASTSILHNPDSTANKEEVIRKWSSALFDAGVLGKRYFAKPDRGTAEEEMKWIQEQADIAKRELQRMGVKVETYQPAATSIDIPHNKWKATGLSIIGTLSAAFKVLNIHREKASVIIFGFGNIAESSISLLKSEGVKIVGVADIEGAVYNSEGLDADKLLRLRRRGKGLADYDKDKAISQTELLSKRATVLLTLAVPHVITTFNYKSLKVKLIVDSVYSSLQRGVDMERLLQDEKSILYLPSCLSSGGGAWASSEEIFHHNADIDVHNMKNHVLDTIRKLSFTTTILLLKMWLASDKRVPPAHILKETAESIRVRRNDLLRNPTSDVDERAEYYALVKVPEEIAYMFASVAAAKDEILYKDEDTLNLCNILRDERTLPWEKAYAAYILGRKRDLRAEKTLVTALHKKSLDKQSPQIRENAAEALGQIWAGGAIEELLAVYKDPSERASLKNWVGWTLEKMGVASHFAKRHHKSVTFKRAMQEIPRKIVRRYIYRKGRHIKRPVIIGISGFSASGKTYFVKILLEKLREEFGRKLPGQEVKVVHLEIDYYLLAKEERVPRAERLGIPLSIFIKFEFQRFVNDMKRLAARKPIYVPRFNQLTRKRERADEGLMQEVRTLAEQGARKVRLEFEGQSHTLVRHGGLSNKENRGVYIDLQNGDILRELKPGVDIIVIAEGILALADKEAVNVYDEAVFITAPWGFRLKRDIQRYIETGKYASLTTKEVNAKFERKRIQEETKYILDQQNLATYIIDTSDARVPAYVNGYLKALGDYQTWISSLLTAHPERPITLEQREKKLNELFILHRLDRIKKTPLLHKVWTRLYQNLIVPKKSSAFKAVSDFVSEQNKEGYFTMSAAGRDRVVKRIIDEHKLNGDKSIELMFLHAVQPPDVVVKAVRKVIKRKRVKPKRRRPAALEGLSAAAEKSIAVKILGIFAPHRMDLLDELLEAVDYSRRVTTGQVTEIDKLVAIFMNLGIFKDSKMKYRFIFMHEAVHFLQRKGIIPLVKYEKDVDGQRELVPALVELAILFFEISGKEEFSEFLTKFFKAEPEVEYGMKAYREALREEEILKEVNRKFADYMETTQTMFRDEDVSDDAETWRRNAPKAWLYFLAHVVSGMAYAYALDKEDLEKIWDYVIAFIKYGGERLKLSEDEIRYALDDFENSGLSKIPFKSGPDPDIKSSSAGRQGEQADPLMPAFPMSIKGLMADAGYGYEYPADVTIQKDGRISIIIYGDLEIEDSCFDRPKNIETDIIEQLRKKGYLIEARTAPGEDRVHYYVLFAPFDEDFSIPKPARADPDIFKRDIRAEIEKLPDDVCYNLGRSFATLLRESTDKQDLWVAAGGDARESTPRTYYYFVRGLLDSGINVYGLGTVPTLVVYFAVPLYEADGFASVTGSHNPPGYNGIKPGMGGINLDIEQMARLKEIFFSGRYCQSGKRGKIVDKNNDGLDAYVKYMQAYLLAAEEEWQEDIINGKNLKADIEAILKKHKGEQPLENRRIAFDSGNGACGYLPQRAWMPLGADLRLLYPEFNGTYPHHLPNPQELENLKDIIELVGAESCELGFAVDGDMDRVGAVDPGQITGEDIFSIIAEEVLKNNPDAKVVVEAKASYSLMEHIRRYGGEIVISSVGFSNVHNAISDEGAILGGETSGHIYMRDNGYRDDGLFVATALLKIMAKTGKTLRQLLSDVHYYHISPEFRIFLKKNNAAEIISDLKRLYQGRGDYEINEIDGIRIQLNDKQGRWLGWFIVRASATEPKLTVRFEGRNEHYFNRMAKELFGFLSRYKEVEFGKYAEMVNGLLTGTPAAELIPTPAADDITPSPLDTIDREIKAAILIDQAA